LRELLKIEGSEDADRLRDIVKQFRDDELHHLDTAVDCNARKVSTGGHAPKKVPCNVGYADSIHA
jgi:ubiquinone biosynthesis monooxygenase Coq7